MTKKNDKLSFVSGSKSEGCVSSVATVKGVKQTKFLFVSGVLLFFLIMGSALGVKAQGSVNEDRYITLTVENNQDVGLDLWADVNDTPIKIVSGSQVYNITVDEGWTGFSSYTTESNEMIIYGNIKMFDCSGNGAKVTGLDVSKNTALTGIWCNDDQISELDVSENAELEKISCVGNQISSLDVSQNLKLFEIYCQNNPFTTEAVDSLFCSLPDQADLPNAKIFILNNIYDDNYEDVLHSNRENAIDRNWKVWFYDDYSGPLADTDVPTIGEFECGGVNMYRYITLNVKNGENIQLDMWGATGETPIKIISGDLEYNATLTDNWTGIRDYLAGADVMTIYGNVERFDCSTNGYKVTGLDPGKNEILTKLYCFGNQLTSLDVSKNTELNFLSCLENQITSLDVSQNTKLVDFSCSENELTSLDVSQNTELTRLWCYDNPFPKQEIDALFCSLPDRTNLSDAQIYILDNASDENYQAVLSTNKKNATDKNWKVWYYDNYSGPYANTDIPETTGVYDCNADVDDVYSSDLALYPNPVAGGFTLETQEHGVLEIHSVTGEKVRSVQITSDKQFVDVNDLSSGVYFAEINGRVIKFTKK